MSIDSVSVDSLLELAHVRQMTTDGRAKRLRIEKMITQEEVGRLCGVKPSTVSKWEDGHRMPRGESGRRYVTLIATLEKT